VFEKEKHQGLHKGKLKKDFFFSKCNKKILVVMKDSVKTKGRSRCRYGRAHRAHLSISIYPHVMMMTSAARCSIDLYTNLCLPVCHSESSIPMGTYDYPQCTRCLPTADHTLCVRPCTCKSRIERLAPRKLSIRGNTVYYSAPW